MRNSIRHNKNFFNFSRISFFRRTLLKLKGNTNFYQILGISHSATQEQIREAYLKLAKKYHPDVNKQADADEKFKMITVAYEGLYDEKKRDAYDEYVKSSEHPSTWKAKNETGNEEEKAQNDFYRERAKFDKFSEDFYKKKKNSDFWAGTRNNFEEEIYKDFDKVFNSGFTRNTQQSKQKGEDVLLQIDITLEEAYYGVNKGIKFKKSDKCKSCDGLRSERGHRPSKCFHCNGTGKIKTNYYANRLCSSCKGLGLLIKHPCKECKGRGCNIYETEEIIKIPKGIKSGVNIVIHDKGNMSENIDFLIGDLIVKVNIVENEGIKRIVDDLIVSLKISLKQAVFGDLINYECMNKKFQLKIPAGTQNNDKLVMKNQGFYNEIKDNTGDMIIIYSVIVPNIEDFPQNERKRLIDILKSNNV